MLCSFSGAIVVSSPLEPEASLVTVLIPIISIVCLDNPLKINNVLPT